MPPFDALRSALPEPVAQRLPELVDAFVAEEHTDDVVELLAWLRDRGHLDDDSLRKALLAVEPAISLSHVLDEHDRRWTRLGLLGRGAMGEVHLVHDRRLRRTVAVKRMDAALVRDAGLKARFLDEAQISAQLDHPGIIPVYGLQVRTDGTIEYAMKLVRGQTLDTYLAACRERLDKGGRLDEDQRLPARLELFLQVCHALAHAHSRGVLHRDLKPENVMIGAFHEVIVMDWGIAKRIGAAEAALTGLDTDEAHSTQLGTALGTPAYMSPEQADGRNDELDARSDQYALGLILQELATLRRAVSSKTTVHALLRAQEADRDPVAAYVRGEPVARELEAVIAKATALSPDGRYPSVRALADDVRRYLRDEAVLAAPDKGLQRVLRWIGHHRQLTLVAVLGLCALMLALVVLGLIGGVGALEASRYAAAVREERLSDLTAGATRQATRIDIALLTYQGLLRGLAAGIEEAIAHDPGEVPVFLEADFDDPTRAPADMGASKIYGERASLLAPDLVLSPGVDAASVELRLRQLATARTALERAMLLSADEALLHAPEAERRQRILENGVPIVWTYAGFEEGVLVGFPGTGEYPDDYDARGRPWYLEAKAADRPVWSALDIDESGLGLLVTGSAPVRDRAGALVGVAAVDLTFGHVIDTLLEPPDLAAPVEAFLVDGEGRVVVRSSQKDAARTATEYTPEAFPWPSVLEATARSGHVEHAEGDDDLVVAWSRLEALDWTYVLVGDRQAVLGAWF